MQSKAASFSVLLLLFFTWLSGCQKDSKIKPSTPPSVLSPSTPSASKCRLLKYSYTTQTTTGTLVYHYDTSPYDTSSDARISKLVYAEDDFYTLEYNSQNQLTKSVHYTSEKLTRLYQYDEQGHWIKTLIQGGFSTTNDITYTGSETIHYDAQGRRSKIEGIYSTGDKSFRSFTYKEGNGIEEVFESISHLGGEGLKITTTREYYQDKENKNASADDRLAPLFAFSTPAATLLKKMSMAQGEIREFSYEFNQQGYPVKATLSSTFPDKPPFIGSAFYEYQCD